MSHPVNNQICECRKQSSRGPPRWSPGDHKFLIKTSRFPSNTCISPFDYYYSIPWAYKPKRGKNQSSTRCQFLVSILSMTTLPSGASMVLPRGHLRYVPAIQTLGVRTRQQITRTTRMTTTALPDLSVVVQGLAWTSVGLYAYNILASRGPVLKEGEQACETCGGTGFVECFCTRWSDGDTRGCASCGGSLHAHCHSCRGGGTAVPIEARVLIKSEKKY